MNLAATTCLRGLSCVIAILLGLGTAAAAEERGGQALARVAERVMGVVGEGWVDWQPTEADEALGGRQRAKRQGKHTFGISYDTRNEVTGVSVQGPSRTGSGWLILLSRSGLTEHYRLSRGRLDTIAPGWSVLRTEE